MAVSPTDDLYQCDGCEFDYKLEEASGAGQAIMDGAEKLASIILDAHVVKSRPEPGTWSPLEYTCHVRDVLLVQRERVLAAQFIDQPSFNPMGQDERVALDGYADQSIDDVLRQLRDSALLFANVLRPLNATQWNRAVMYGSPVPTKRSLQWLAVHTLHEVRHHVDDIWSQLA